MSLIDKYKESLRQQGLQDDIQVYKIRRNRTNLYLLLIILAIGVPVYLLIFHNYTTCTSYSQSLPILGNVNSSSVGSGLTVRCGVNTTMYSITAALVIALVIFLIIRAMRYKRIG